MRERESIPSDVQKELASMVASETARLARQTATGRAARKVARLTKGDGAIGAPEAPIEKRVDLRAATMASLLAMASDTYASALRFATAAARKGRLCGTKGRRKSWGTANDTGGLVPLPARQDSGDDTEAATDAVGRLWCEAHEGSLEGDGFPLRRLYWLARTLGARSAARRVRELPLDAATDRTMPAGVDRAMTLAELLDAVPPSRRAMAQAKIAEYERRIGARGTAAIVRPLAKEPSKRTLQRWAQRRRLAGALARAL